MTATLEAPQSSVVATSSQDPNWRPFNLDADTFNAKFNRQPFAIKHNLADHPLFTLPRLVELARSLPEKNVKYNSGKLDIGQGLYTGTQTGLSAEDTIRGIEECNSWMVIKWVENDPDYKALLDACLDQIGELTEILDPGMTRRSGFIFISSPGSITPYHIDPEYNFLLQIRGPKTMRVWDPRDRNALPDIEIEKTCATQGQVYNIPFQEEFNKRANVYNMLPGDGIHVPVHAPHWVEVGNGVSISFSITFMTPRSMRRESVYRANAKLRQLGMKPRSFGESERSDAVKHLGYKVANKAGRVLKRNH